MSDDVIRTDGLTKVYGPIRAVDGLDLRVPRGAVYGFLGRTGAGKSTTMRMLMGLARPTTGTATLMGLTWPHDRVSILQRAAYVSQSKRLFASMTARELVRFNRAWFPRWSDEAVTRYAQRFAIPMDRRFGHLSDGNQTIVCLLLALAQGAELLMLDEPLTGLDPVTVNELHRVLVNDYAAEGRTIFVSSHNLAEVEKIADWIGIIHQGRLLLEARIEDIRTTYRRISVAGRALPSSPAPQVISATTSGAFSEYVVTRDADAVVADLRSQGAVVLEVSPLNLEQVFLTFVERESTCTLGNTGEKLEGLHSHT